MMHPTMNRLYAAAKLLKGIDRPADLARLLNQSQQVLVNWEARGVSKGGLLMAQSAIGVSADWLVSGHGEMNTNMPSIPSTGSISIPQYAATGGCGGNGLILQDQPGIINNWTVSQEWLAANISSCTSPANLCIVTGFGDSMPDTYNPGDPILIDTGVTTCDHDGVYFFRVGNEGYIKRLQRIPGVGIRVISQNKDYEAWTIKPDADFQVFGKVLKAWKSRSY